MVSVFTRPTCDVDANEDVSACEEQEKSYPVRHGDPAKEGDPKHAAPGL